MNDGPDKWESPPWVRNIEDNPVDAAIDLLKKMTPQQRALLLQNFPADEVIAVADMLESLDHNQ